MSLIVNFLTNPAAADFVQNSTCQVLSEGCLKAVGRKNYYTNLFPWQHFLL